MNKAAAIGAVIVLLIIIVGVAYVLSGSKSAQVTSTSIGSSSIASTTVAATTISPANNSTSSSPMIPANTVNGTNSSMAGNSVMTSNTAYTVELENSSSLGWYLANGTGFTLYTYTNDVAHSNASACAGSCAANWPPFYTANLVLAPGLNASSFGTISRGGGAMQTTYNGYPLYFFQGDGKTGQVNGNGVGGFKLATK